MWTSISSFSDDTAHLVLILSLYKAYPCSGRSWLNLKLEFLPSTGTNHIKKMPLPNFVVVLRHTEQYSFHFLESPSHPTVSVLFLFQECHRSFPAQVVVVDSEQSERPKLWFRMLKPGILANRCVFCSFCWVVCFSLTRHVLSTVPKAMFLAHFFSFCPWSYLNTHVSTLYPEQDENLENGSEFFHHLFVLVTVSQGTFHFS